MRPRIKIHSGPTHQNSLCPFTAPKTETALATCSASAFTARYNPHHLLIAFVSTGPPLRYAPRSHAAARIQSSHQCFSLSPPQVRYYMSALLIPLMLIKYFHNIPLSSYFAIHLCQLLRSATPPGNLAKRWMAKIYFLLFFLTILRQACRFPVDHFKQNLQEGLQNSTNQIMPTHIDAQNTLAVYATK